MRVTSNLETIEKTKYPVATKRNQFDESIPQNEELIKLNNQIEDTDRKNFRMILDIYFNLFESNPEIF